MNQHTISTTYKNEGGTAFIKSHVIEGDLSQNIEVDIPAGVVNAEIDLVIPITTLLACAFACSKKSGQSAGATVGTLTIKTNSTSTPGNTLTITPTNGICWSDGDDPVNNPCPLTVAVTKLYVSSSGTAIALFIVRALNDSTP